MFVLEEADTVIVLGDGACHKQGAAREWGLIPGMIGYQKVGLTYGNKYGNCSIIFLFF